jgi:hypothetical protein
MSGAVFVTRLLSSQICHLGLENSSQTISRSSLMEKDMVFETSVVHNQVT